MSAARRRRKSFEVVWRVALSACISTWTMAVWLPSDAVAQTLEVIHGFAAPGGAFPRGSLLHASDGNFYGTTEGGGLWNAGSIFRLTPAGDLVSVHMFNKTDGAYPQSALIQAADGTLYGATRSGGEHGYGTIFSTTLDGVFTLRYSFTGSDDGAVPTGIILAVDGNFYGVTQGAGAHGRGTLFRMTGAGQVTTVHAFDAVELSGAGTTALFPGSGNFNAPWPLLESRDGLLYGMAQEECGSIIYCTVPGIVYSITRDGEFRVVHEELIRSQSFVSPLIEGNDGTIYGSVRATDGCLPLFCYRSIFRLLSGTRQHADVVTQQAGPLTLASDGNLYWTEYVPWADDMLMSVSTDGTGLAALHTFVAEEGKINLDGPLIQATDGNLYGPRGSSDVNRGTIIRADLSGAVAVLHVFNFPGSGARPNASLIQAIDGSLYGSTQVGSPSNGPTLFSMTLAGEPAHIASVQSTPSSASLVQTSDADPVFVGTDDFYLFTWDGQTPFAEHRSATFFAHVSGLTVSTQGLYYVTTVDGGESAIGSVVLEDAYGTKTILHSFNGTDGAAPNDAPTEGVDGNFYGATTAGGAADRGVLYRMTPDGSTTVLHDFSGPDGAHPTAPLIRASDGSFLGTADEGGASGAGTIFRLDIAGQFTLLHVFDGGAGGAAPKGRLMQASDGNIYGTTVNGGTFGLGTIFRLTPAGVFTTIHSFNGEDGAGPAGGLVEASDHNLYGTTELGGAENAGVVFRLSLPPCEDTLSLSYAADTLTMHFGIRSATPSNFATWLVTSFGVFQLWNVPIPVVPQTVSFDVPVPGFPHIGNVGMLTIDWAASWTTLCWDWKIVNTGGSGPSAAALTDRLRKSDLLPR